MHRHITVLIIQMHKVIQFTLLFLNNYSLFTIFYRYLFQLTRDEHLLLILFVLLALDLVILLPWALLDPIECHRRTVEAVANVCATDVECCLQNLSLFGCYFGLSICNEKKILSH